MQFDVKWRPTSQGHPRSIRYESKIAAELWARKQIADGCLDVWIDDTRGHTVVTYEQLKLKHERRNHG